MEFDGCTPLALPVPPMLEAALGYVGPAQLVAFFWSPVGDEARFADARIEADADWFAFRLFVDTPAVATALTVFDLGSSETAATHWLLLNRETRQLAVGVRAAVQAALRQQWPHEPLPVTHAADGGDDFTVLLATLPHDVYTAAYRQQALATELQQWLAVHFPRRSPVSAADLLADLCAEFQRDGEA